MKYVFGVDIGGTTVKMGFLTSEGELLEKWEIPTDRSNNGANILSDVAASIDSKITEKGIDKADVIGVGAGVPGPVDSNGIIHSAANLGWGVFNASEEFSRLTGLKAMVGNDANVAALGEMWKGGGVGYKDIVMVTLGTGVGGGIIIDGKIVNGSAGAGGAVSAGAAGSVSDGAGMVSTCVTPGPPWTPVTGTTTVSGSVASVAGAAAGGGGAGVLLSSRHACGSYSVVPWTAS